MGKKINDKNSTNIVNNIDGITNIIWGKSKYPP